MIKELDLVVLTRDLPASKLNRGDIGTVVLVHGDGAGYEGEFATLAGETLAVLTLPASDVRPITRRDVAHVREVA